MTTEFNEWLPVSPEDKVQIWIIDSRNQITHLINELYMRKLASDFPLETLRERAQFTPIAPAPFAASKYMSVLVRSKPAVLAIQSLKDLGGLEAIVFNPRSIRF
jgi:hypothetical protein